MGDFTGSQYLAIEWSLLSLCIILVSIRLAVRVWRRLWAFWISDVLLVVAVLFFVFIGTIDLISITASPNSPLADPTNVTTEYWRYIFFIIFFAAFYLPRFSLLAFYYELFPFSESRLRIFLHCATVYVIACFVATFFMNIFWCGLDVSRNWVHKDDKTCYISTEAILVNWAVSFTTELLVFILPLPLFNTLKTMERREKVGLIVIFLLGLITIIVSCVRMWLEVQDQYMYPTYIIEITEIATQIMMVTLPALRPLLGVIRKKAKSVYIRRRKSYATISMDRSTMSGGRKDLSAASSGDRSASRPLGHQTTITAMNWESIELPEII